MIGLAMMLAAATADQQGPKFFKSGNELYENCTSSDANDTLECLSYITGVNDGFVTTSIINKPLYCTTTDVSLGQIRDVVVRYLRDNPQNRDWSGGTLIAMAMAQAFPCPKN